MTYYVSNLKRSIRKTLLWRATTILLSLIFSCLIFEAKVISAIIFCVSCKDRIKYTIVKDGQAVGWGKGSLLLSH